MCFCCGRLPGQPALLAVCTRCSWGSTPVAAVRRQVRRSPAERHDHVQPCRPDRSATTFLLRVLVFNRACIREGLHLAVWAAMRRAPASLGLLSRLIRGCEARSGNADKRRPATGARPSPTRLLPLLPRCLQARWCSSGTGWRAASAARAASRPAAWRRQWRQRRRSSVQRPAHLRSRQQRHLGTAPAFKRQV